jgi:hypothetical protein
VRCREVIVALAALAAPVGLTGCGALADEAAEDRQSTVAERGETVMPFDLDATTHVFTPTEDGGIQEVRADEPGDVNQIALVREHLEDEARRFRAGDFDDPAAIHGHDMPGLAELEAGHDSISVDYAESPAGATITYATDNPALVDALHVWFEAQVMDHGAHAEAGG